MLQKPLRIASSIGYDVKWNEDDQQISLRKDNREVYLNLSQDSFSLSINEIFNNLNAILINGTTYVPLQNLSKLLNFKVDVSSYEDNIIEIIMNPPLSLGVLDD